MRRIIPVVPAKGDAAALRAWAFDVGDRRSSLRLYRGVWVVSKFLLHRYLRVQAENTSVLDGDGPLVLAPVHRSHLDTILVATVSRRRLRALGKESLFTTPVVGWVCAALGAIPVRRGAADREALKAAKALLDRGEPIFVFPEGGRFSGATSEENNTVQELYDGAAWLASRTGAPVVPIGIAGTADALGSGAKWIRRSVVRIVVGEPMTPPQGEVGKRASRADLANFTAELGVHLQRLQDRAIEQAVAG